MSLFRHLLGPALDAMPPSLLSVHDAAAPVVLAGTARVWRSRNPVARLLCELMRLPRAGAEVPVTIRFERTAAGEVWRRDFGGRTYASHLSARHGLMVERMGPATSFFRLSVEANALVLELNGFRYLGVALPRCLRPRCRAVERDADGRFSFDIPVSLPWLGPVIHYSGRLAPTEESDT